MQASKAAKQAEAKAGLLASRAALQAEEEGVQTPLLPNVTKGTKSRVQQLEQIFWKPDFLATWIVPCCVFLVVNLLFTYAFMQLPSLCFIVAMSATLLGVLLLLLRNRGHIWFPLGITTLLAVCIGVGTGLFVYEQFACYVEFYAHSRVYTNVVPSQSSDAVADAGGFTFSSTTVVDTKRSSGFISEAGYVYCAAPVMDDGEMTRVSFWAVGVDCCGAAGSFTCDQSKDSNAKAGVRVFDNSGWFYDSNHDFYVKARRKAEATYSLVSVGEPLYVRWVSEDNLNMMSNFYRGQAAMATVGLILMYLVVAAGFSFALYRRRKSKPETQWTGPGNKLAA